MNVFSREEVREAVLLGTYPVAVPLQDVDLSDGPELLTIGFLSTGSLTMLFLSLCHNLSFVVATVSTFPVVGGPHDNLLGARSRNTFDMGYSSAVFTGEM